MFGVRTGFESGQTVPEPVERAKRATVRHIFVDLGLRASHQGLRRWVASE